MARLVKHEAHAPKEVKTGTGSAHICMCGLSNNQPLCDGSHSLTTDEERDVLYVYDKDGNRIKVVNQYS